MMRLKSWRILVVPHNLLVDPIVTSLRGLGKKLLKRRENHQVDGEWVGRQLKSTADLLANEVITKCLENIAPGIPIISEENIASQVGNRPSQYWLIDPIDGTASYVNGFDGFVLQVALIENELPVLGVIYAPATQELFTATRGHGAWKNGKKLKVISSPSKIKLIDNYPEPRGISGELFKALSHCEYIESGSLSLKMLRVLEGTADVFVKDVIVRDWDFAAPMAVCIELEGIISQFNGSPFSLKGNWGKGGVIVCRNLDLYKKTLLTLDALQENT
jgi:3'(2'), 5'-bisphosphate nucleotidase